MNAWMKICAVAVFAVKATDEIIDRFVESLTQDEINALILMIDRGLL